VTRQRGITRRQVAEGGLALAAVAGLAGLSGCGDLFGEGGSGSPGSEAVLESLPDYGVPAPNAYLRSNWSKDPFALCAYSCMPPGPPGPAARKLLREPVADRLLFAGEATSSANPAMVHGALESGWRAADTIEEFAPAGARVAVVGAGAAGLACARQLVDAGFDVTLIEARDRVGGRVWTEQIAGLPAEMGASWIHGVKGNPLTSIADASGVGLVPFEYENFFPDFRQRAEGEVGLGQLNAALESFDWNSQNAVTTPMSSLLPVRRTPGLEWAINSEISQEYGADPAGLSVFATDEGDWLRGGDALLAGSYQQMIVDATLEAEDSGDIPVMMETVVAEVRYGGTGVEVVDTGGDVTDSDFAVITVPIGVLKSGSIRFDPGLPASTLQGIGGLGLGLLDKLWLAFDEVFWDEDVEMISWIDPERPGLWAEWVNGYRAFGEPVLLGFNGGSEAWRVAGLDDRTVVESGMNALSGLYR
jgi:monoamine oxidase